MKSYLEISDVGISFETEQGSFEALSRVNLRIEKGEFVSALLIKSKVGYSLPNPPGGLS